jgi:hypothetical protein
MATYVNDLRLKEIATGDESGTWGASVNTQYELIAEAMGAGTEAIANASTHTITMADGATDGFRCTFLRLTGGGQACTVTLAPNTVSHTWIIRNATSYALTFTQGSGANVIIAAGQAKIVSTDGAGSGAIVYECLEDLELGGTLTVGVDDTGHDVKFFGATSGAYMLWDESADDLKLVGAAGLTVAGDIDIDGTANLDIVDIDGAVNLAADVTYADGADIITASAGTSNFRAGVNAGNSIESGGNYNVVVGDEAGTAITTGDNNVAVGYKALEVDNTGSNNTALGYSALEANTTAADNVAVGYKALELNSTGASNTALGKQAMQANTTASNGTAVGFSALYANTTGRDNTAVGYSAGTTNTTGLENTALGMYALRFNTTGNTNTAVGLQALHRNTTASDNTAIGKNAMEQNTTGADNVAVGAGALDANTTAGSNTAVGKSALGATTTGALNSALGSSALTNNTTGANNVAMGFAASQLNTSASNNTALGYAAMNANTTGANNVAVGANALDANTTASDNTAIGDNALGANTTGASNTSIGINAGNGNTTAANNVYIGNNSGVESVVNQTGGDGIYIGAFAHGTATDSQAPIVIGYNVAGDAGYTTLGNGADDIRAAHGNVTWATVSDERVKKDIEDSTVGLSFINDLRPRTFKYKAKGDIPEEFKDYEEGSTEAYKNSNTNHGFIAQEVKAVIDNHSDIVDGFRMWDVRESGQQEVAEAAIIPMLTKAIQELSAKIAELEAQPRCKCNGE